MSTPLITIGGQVLNGDGSTVVSGRVTPLAQVEKPHVKARLRAAARATAPRAAVSPDALRRYVACALLLLSLACASAYWISRHLR